MKRWGQHIFLIFLFYLGLSPGLLLACNYVVFYEKGAIDWTKGIVEAWAKGCAGNHPDQGARTGAPPTEEAVTRARENLKQIIMEMRIDSKSLLKDHVARSKALAQEVHGFLKQAPVVDPGDMPEGAVTAVVSIKVTGAFSQIVLPKSIRTIRPVQQPNNLHRKGEPVHTGLILDCRGLEIKPALVLRVVDEDGNEIYGPAYVSRAYAIRQGMARYLTVLEGPPPQTYVGKRPLAIKGLKAAGPGHSDIVISNADAENIRGTPSNLSLLQKCRVLVVLDKNP